MEKELQTTNLIENLLNLKKKVCVPKIIGKNSNDMIMTELTEINQLKDKTKYLKNSWGIAEAVEPFNKIEFKDISLVLVPGLGFDENCNRIGHGKGYYDNFLTSVRKQNHNQTVKFIGICLDCQVLDTVPTTEHDVILDFIISPNHHFINKNQVKNK